jgi:hypothetical protein
MQFDDKYQQATTQDNWEMVKEIVLDREPDLCKYIQDSVKGF